MALYIVATPIGNRDDISKRALDVLATVSLVACEDTRTSGTLLRAYGINTRLTSFHEYSDERKVVALIAQLVAGDDIALITDAGTPGISDPGYPLIRDAIAAGVRIIPIPGASAFLAALSVCGFPLHRFTFMGFVPHTKGRETFFKTVAATPDTCVLYESPHRIQKMAQQVLQHISPLRPMCITRELTKLHEEVVRGTTASVCDALLAKQPRGEYVVVFGPSVEKSVDAQSKDAIKVY